VLAGLLLVVDVEVWAIPAPLSRQKANTNRSAWAIRRFIVPPSQAVVFDRYSGIDAALAISISHHINGEHVGGNAIVDVVGFVVAHHVVKGSLHDVLELLVNHGFLPKVALTVLNPFEVRGGDASCIGQNVC